MRLTLALLSWPWPITSSTTPSPSHGSGELDPSTFDNVVIIPDIHGDDASFLRSLWLAFNDIEGDDIEFTRFRFHILAVSSGKIKGPALSRSSSSTLLVQLGDVVDRGPHGLSCLAILESIEASIGWRTVRLYGNHEFLSHDGLSNEYIHPLEVDYFDAKFGRPFSRATEFATGGRVWTEIVSSRLLIARIGAVPPLSPEARDPPIPPLTSSSTLFVHGGMELDWLTRVMGNVTSEAESVVDALNRLTRDAATNEESLFYKSLGQRQSPLWIRDLGDINREYVCERILPKLLKEFNVARVVVGHIPQWDLRVKALCDSRLVLADAAMSKWMFSGDDLFGNPTAVLMRQSNGVLASIRSLGFEDFDQTVQRQTLYSAEVARPPPSVGRWTHTPVLSSVQALSREHNTPWSVSYQLKATLVNFEGLAAYEGVLELRDTLAASKSFGSPRIVHISGFDQASQPPNYRFHILMDVEGPLLSSLRQLDLSIVRQIFEAVWDLWHAGFVIDKSRQVRDVFIMDSLSKLVKLVDFTAIVPRADESATLSEIIERIVDELAAVTEPYMSVEPIDFMRIVMQTWDLGDNEGVNRTQSAHQASVTSDLPSLGVDDVTLGSIV